MLAYHDQRKSNLKIIQHTCTQSTKEDKRNFDLLKQEMQKANRRPEVVKSLLCCIFPNQWNDFSASRSNSLSGPKKFPRNP